MAGNAVNIIVYSSLKLRNGLTWKCSAIRNDNLQFSVMGYLRKILTVEILIFRIVVILK